MTKGNFFRYYNKLTGADRTLIFFERKGIIYIYNCKHIAPRWAHEEFESSKNGGQQKFKMYISVSEKDKLIAKGATPIMTKAEFEAIPYKNKGHKCEAYLHKACGLGEYTPDHVRFDYCGDVEIGGIQYQVKYENASLTNVDVLHKAQKRAREMRKGK